MSVPFVVQVAVEPKSEKDRCAFIGALHGLLKRELSFGAVGNEECGQTVLRAGDECKLIAAIDQLQFETGGRINVGAPQVAYRESLANWVDVDYTYKQQSGGSGQFGRIMLTVGPGKLGQGVIFKNEVLGGSIPTEYIASIEKGVRETAATGTLTGFPIVDFTATLYGGAFHEVDSSALAFEAAGRGGMRDAAQRAGIKLMEPIMKVVVLAPDQWIERIVAGLLDRHGELVHQINGDLCVVVALAPMAQLFGYGVALASASEGEARHTMLVDHYGEVPPNILFPDDTFPAAAALRA